MSRTPLESLSPACIDVTARSIDWEAAGGEFGEDLEYWQHFTHDVDDVDFDLVANRSSVLAVKLDGRWYESDEYDVYADLKADEDGNPIPGTVTESTFDELFNVEPYMSGVEGPMMNFFYPLPTSFRRGEVAAAAQLHNMCLVSVDGDYGLALTGGGMDMTWYIVMSYVGLGYLPPVDFCEVPYDIDEESMQYLGSAMARSVTFMQQRMGWKLDTLKQRIPGITLPE